MFLDTDLLVGSCSARLPGLATLCCLQRLAGLATRISLSQVAGFISSLQWTLLGTYSGSCILQGPSASNGLFASPYMVPLSQVVVSMSCQALQLDSVVTTWPDSSCFLEWL